MPRVAALIAATLKLQDPVDASYFAANLRRFDAALTPWIDGIARVRTLYAGTPVAITEPVFGYEAQALGLRILTPPSFALAIMDGNDPSPQDTQTEISLFTAKRVKVFFYNQQAVAPITVRLLGLARSQHIAIVGVYETKPLAMTYQQWMLAELQAAGRVAGYRVRLPRTGLPWPFHSLSAERAHHLLGPLRAIARTQPPEDSQFLHGHSRARAPSPFQASACRRGRVVRRNRTGYQRRDLRVVWRRGRTRLARSPIPQPASLQRGMRRSALVRVAETSKARCGHGIHRLGRRPRNVFPLHHPAVLWPHVNRRRARHVPQPLLLHRMPR
jgi:Zinc-uptake complex component A periplasmic